MRHEDREREKKPKRKNELQQQLELVSSLIEEVRTIDSEIDLIKQKMNLVIREINVLKRVVLSEKKAIAELETEESQDRSRLESLVNIIREMRGMPPSEETKPKE